MAQLKAKTQAERSAKAAKPAAKPAPKAAKPSTKSASKPFKLIPSSRSAMNRAVEVAWMHVAAGELAQAAALADEVAARVVFKGNYRIWNPAMDVMMVGARLARLRGDEVKRSYLIGRNLEHSSFSTNSDRESVDAWIGEAEKFLSKGTIKSIAEALARSNYFREMHGQGQYYDAWLDLSVLDQRIERGLALVAVC